MNSSHIQSSHTPLRIRSVREVPLHELLYIFVKPSLDDAHLLLTLPTRSHPHVSHEVNHVIQIVLRDQRRSQRLVLTQLVQRGT